MKSERAELPISLTEMAKGSWVVFEAPGFSSIDSAKQQPSLDALRKATDTSYFKESDVLWVKLVVSADPQGVGREQCGPLDVQASLTVRK